MRLSLRPRGYHAVVAITALFLISGTAFAAASFSGQGTVPFDAIRVGKNDKNSQIQLQGPILNPGKHPDGKGRPINVSDDLVVKGNATITGKLTLTGDLIMPESNAWIRTPGDFYVGIDDDLQVMGDLSATGTATFTGAIYSGGVNLTSRASANQATTNALLEFTQCVMNLSAVDGDVRRDDYVDCWNIWIAGRVTNVP